MNRYRISIPATSLLFILFFLISACGNKTIPATVATEPAGGILELVGPNGGRILSLADLKGFPVTEGEGGIKSSTGQITLPGQFTGVSLKDLITSLGVTLDPSMGVTITAEDGYSMTFSYDQIMNGAFTAYDPALGNELFTHDPLTAIIAYDHDGQPLNPVEDGNLRLVVVSNTNDQVVDGHWSVKWVNKVEVATMGETWQLDVQGALSLNITRDSFQSCGSPGCHGTSWQDIDGQSWIGVPLWLLVGEVDDQNSHDDNAYNLTLADSGYTVDLIAADGFSVTLDSQTIKKNNDVLVAFTVNDGELPEQYYPLRLVGSDLQKSQMVGQISKIIVNVPEAALPTITSVPENTGSIAIKGLVDKEIELKDADLRAMEITTITAEDKDGPKDFQGVALNSLLDKAGIKEGTTKMVLTASDNYSITLDLSEVRSCPKAILAFMDDPGNYRIILPDLPTSDWVKNVIMIEIQ